MFLIINYLVHLLTYSCKTYLQIKNLYEKKTNMQKLNNIDDCFGVSQNKNAYFYISEVKNFQSIHSFSCFYYLDGEVVRESKFSKLM